jgi:hypothetical protein
MKFSPSTINQRLAAIRKLATEAQRCAYVDSETAQAIVAVILGLDEPNPNVSPRGRGAAKGSSIRRRRQVKIQKSS